jgi:Zn-dependent protease
MSPFSAQTNIYEQISAEARAAAERGDLSEELRLWRTALDMLPPGTPEYNLVRMRVVNLTKAIDEGAHESRHAPKWIKVLGPLAPVLLLLWKFKGLAALLLSKGKLILFGLGKFSTFSSMLVSLAAYWALYGWWFGLGLVLSIYVHEMGHVWALRRFGFAASAPMFIPLVGAFVRMKQHPVSAVEDARIGLAGPIWGTVAAIGLFATYAATGIGVIGAVAHFAAWLNLFNLIPVWQLDGARGMRALSQNQRIVLVAVLAGMFLLTREGFLLILGALALLRVFRGDRPEQGDTRTLAQFCGLVIVLSILMELPTPGIRQ